MFDFHTYLRSVVAWNRLANKHNFLFGTCSGVNGLQELLDNFSTASHFVLSDDTTTGETFQEGGAWWQRRTFTTFVLARHDFGSEAQRTEAMTLCRELVRQLQSRLLRDRCEYLTQDVDFKVDNMPATEVAQFFANGLTGLYFMVSIDEPLNLCYNEDEWEDPALRGRTKPLRKRVGRYDRAYLERPHRNDEGSRQP